MRLYNKYFLTIISLGVIMIVLAFINHSIIKSEIHSSLISEVEKPHPPYMDGDIVFQNSSATYSQQIKRITHCQWDQMGVLFSRNNQWFVYEAGDEINFIDFSQWIDHGTEGKYEVKRLKNADKILDDTVLNRMKTFTEDFLHRDYDIFLLSDDDRLYNSELVYKMFLRCAGIKLGEMKPLRDYDLTSPETQKFIRIKYGNNVSKDSLIISPDEIFNSDKLITIYMRE